ncbi:hypothetical protein KJR28_00650 [Streptococcus lutetiensis]|uniref:hypothetical protein n=1 Tax=Streptococcus lutetiensis TaxID=150055 RepID=UPI001BDA2494|nr:hypothetical protein [Streptococcus lutetiensis]MBT0890541.1 hypothetical protein [Streptococcus lutetiensis]MBT0903088.1 hypothetical protein [Streptococcus lutetiensis]MBT0922255.1 hypothetical protein [Streptococcus lutetiensis]
MPKIKVTFADSSTVIFHEEQGFQTIVKRDNETSLGEFFSLWNHIREGLIPSFTTLLVNSLFFYDVENPSVVYSSSAVVKVEEL